MGYSIDPRHAGPRASAIGGLRRLFDADQVPWRRRQSVAYQGNEGAVARGALAASTKEHAETFTDPCAHFQGRIWNSRSGSRTPAGRFQLLKVYPICRWSGDLGPKVNEGDRQAPEGFYTITPGLMNPNSNYYLAINTGFPNAFDRANDRDGTFLMIHGDCSSSGCYAMTDEQIGEIYSLARELFLGGQPSFQIQAYPFRMTPANLAPTAPIRTWPFGRCSK